ncbi:MULTISPECIES: hypothetical protein [unclassified Geodermatophilus]|uniref:hypothetical protein n=1 Tax=unclassified Geodermatophilus TaxID=2637632 RepID=UPI003EEA582C
MQATLFGTGAVHTLDGHEHRVRKALFVAPLMDAARTGPLVDCATTAWDAAVPGWVRQGRIVLLEEARVVLTRAPTTVVPLSALAVRLARLHVDVPEQDLTISLRRIPARPADGVVVDVRGTS